MIKQKLKVINKLPPYYKIADALWGADANIDSDGDSVTPDSTAWTELTLILRSDETQRIDIDPIEESKDLMLKSGSSDLLHKTLSYLKNYGSIK